MREPTKRGRYAKGEARRQEIIDRALEVFTERGASAMSLRAIAQELGVTHASIQHYFGSIEEVLLEVVERRDTLNRNAGGDAELLQEQLHRGAVSNSETPGLTALFTSQLAASVEPSNELSRAYFQARFARGRAELVESINAGRESGAVPAGPDAEHIAALIMAAFDGLQIQWLLDPSVDIEETLRLLDPLLGAAAATPRSSRSRSLGSLSSDGHAHQEAS